VAKSLHGNWDEALLFALKVALETYRFNQIKIQDCDGCIEHHLAQFESRAEVINSPQNLKIQLHRVCGASFRPRDIICRLRSLHRHRDNLVSSSASEIQHI
jgi:hypothetical protein